ncbi:MAG: hypothetical protein AAGC44_02180 [Planctomycetota bacterium]
MLNRPAMLLLYAWAGPNTLLGLGFGILARATGGGWQVHTGVVEVYGGRVAWLLEHVPFVPGGALALTLGHCVLARSQAAHEITRKHERVHVRQYERWGPLFLPGYVLVGVIAWAKGRDPYRDNAFEIEAYNNDGQDRA